MISFIVPAYNEERLLEATLQALHAAARAQGVDYELIVADDASTDNTAAIAQSQGAIVVPVAHRQISATRNSGARAAHGDVFIFVDADTLVDAAVVSAALQALRNGAIGGGAAVRFDGVLPLYARLIVPMFVRLFRALRYAAGCFVFCTRGAFEAVGGFDEAYFGAEEVVISRALKRHGRFVVLREPVTSSGRKFRSHSLREVLGTMAGLALRGRSGVKQRAGMDLWYAQRRDDPPQGE